MSRHFEVGGCAERLEEARPILDTFASKVLHMGATGNGQLAKALNNCRQPSELDFWFFTATSNSTEVLENCQPQWHCNILPKLRTFAPLQPGLYNINCAATAEMLPFAAKAQLPLEEFVEVVASGTGQSPDCNGTVATERERKILQLGTPRPSYMWLSETAHP